MKDIDQIYIEFTSVSLIQKFGYQVNHCSHEKLVLIKPAFFVFIKNVNVQKMHYEDKHTPKNSNKRTLTQFKTNNI